MEPPATGSQVGAVKGLAGRGGDEVVVLLLRNCAAGSGEGGDENSGSLHFGGLDVAGSDCSRIGELVV